MRFTWDPRKASSNVRKHSVTFEEAASVFDDEHALRQRHAKPFSGVGLAPRLHSRRNGPTQVSCASHKLTPQEAALEFMIFNLSSCVVPPTDDFKPPPIY
jgi:hypothetical protein